MPNADQGLDNTQVTDRSRSIGIAAGLAKAGRITPLAIILSFVLLTEVVGMVGVMGTKGDPQLILTIFCVLFPPFIAVPFFAILYSRPIVFYAPGDFGGRLKPQDFAEAVAPRSSARVADLMSDYLGTLEGRIASAIAGTEQLKNLISQQGSVDKKQLESDIKNISKEIFSEIQNSDIIKFDLSDIGGKILSVPASSMLTVSEILDFIYFEINKVNYVKPYTYPDNWVLENVRTSERLLAIGRTWASNVGLGEDNRLAKEVGLSPGETFKVIILRKGRRY